MKAWYTSRTIWGNLILALLGIVGEISGIFPISENPKIWVTVTAVLNIALRLITTTQLGTDKK